ncbi:excinuclease ABC subunit UvrC [Desulfobotulus sp. H1]|uniref:UvrABC system protein C n=1 Tax=Desulfobotulus pelophilus TaxID=2823377 RepID=A0ABT3N8B4_9BACT|nr:excinuclease ABC subunit UvrC [Desulfobotulus pelophilus]MCW7753688.1 excinuclease ABC subunit UvrC [Desulfobotulus pelophilus]
MDESQSTEADSPSWQIREKLDRVATGPGVYLMKDTDKRILYVGKAKNLKRRLASYFQRMDQHPVKTGVLVRKITDFDTILTESENEALLLESTLIKQYRPRYNIILKDDKQYPFLRLDVSHPYPGLTIVRRMKKDHARYFGPFSSGSAVRETLKLVNRTFRLRTCKDSAMRNRTRPCLNYQMGVCLGVCCHPPDPQVYAKNVKEAIWVLLGKAPILAARLRKQMKEAAAVQDFERAAEIRDKLFALEKTIKRQVVVGTDMVDRDILARAEKPGMSLFTLLQVRAGLLVHTRHFPFRETLASPADQVSSFIRQYYADMPYLPREILIPEEIEDRDLLTEELSTGGGSRLRIIKPLRGEKVRMLEWAQSNAEKELEERVALQQGDEAVLQRLGVRLGMTVPPRRIECFDNANISGKNPVTGMVVFVNGKADRSLYRRYRIRHVPEQDDYAYMDETLRRRFAPDKLEGDLPDLLLLDGGKGQLNVAVDVLKDMGIFHRFTVAAIAKMDPEKGETEDKIFLPGRMNSLSFAKDPESLFLLMRIRDEAHRTAVSFHRKQRKKTTLHSRMDGIPGVGPRRKSALLQHFGSFRKLRTASSEEIAAVPGFSHESAARVHAFLHSTDFMENRIS